MTHDLATVCPFCGMRHPAVTAISARDAIPQDGVTTLCFTCGSFSVFDSAASGRLRKPTRQEQRYLDHDPKMQQVVAAWRAVKPSRQN